MDNKYIYDDKYSEDRQNDGDVGAAVDGNGDDDTDRTSRKWLSMSTNSGVLQNISSAGPPRPIFFYEL